MDWQAFWLTIRLAFLVATILLTTLIGKGAPEQHGGVAAPWAPGFGAPA